MEKKLADEKTVSNFVLFLTKNKLFSEESLATFVSEKNGLVNLVYLTFFELSDNYNLIP
jgi:hypothetical protein